ncbi:phosphotransferase family protein, partial [Streptomyces sp. NPDC058653]|uniref:phosphotransferase family protein n=1 Tax=Streptomyces sp. NPDC058653 TaxID=3346576 RepID=UPI003664C69E
MESRRRDRAEDVRGVLAARMPGYRVGDVVFLGEGEDNTVHEVNGELIVRFGKDPDPVSRALRVGREARLLTTVAALSPVPVPEPVFTVAEQGCLGYFGLPGVPLIDVPEPRRSAHGASIAATLGELLRALHGVPADSMTGLVGTDVQPDALWLDEARETYAAVVPAVPRAYREP